MNTTDPVRPSLAIIGAGPRGASVLERLAAAEAKNVDIHIIDDADHGAGRVWDRNQTRILCMNTLADAVTLFTEPGATVVLPVVEGPTLYGWMRYLRGERDLPAAQLAFLEAHPPASSIAESYAKELERTRPESNPSRAIYGEYIRWVFDSSVARLDNSVQIIHHHARATAIEGDQVRLSDGTVLTPTTTIMATGWLKPALSEEEKSLRAAEGVWVSPDNPLDQDYSQVPAGEKVLVRGLGMGFFDFMALVTSGRCGVFESDPSTRSGLRYNANGQEPHFVVASNRGYPFLPKSEYKSLPPSPKLERTRKAFMELAPRVVKREKGTINFTEELWPAIVEDAKDAYRDHPNADGEFDIEAWINPLGFIDGPISPEELTAAIADSMARDIQEAVSAWDSPLKAALWSISGARRPAQLLHQHGVMAPDANYNKFMSLGQMVGSGPPLFRTRELLALIDAGLVTFLGKTPEVTTEAGYTMVSPTTNTPVTSSTLVDAWMYNPDVRRAGDSLTLSLLEADRIRPFEDAHGVATASPEVDPATRRVVAADGSTDKRLHLIGIPTSPQYAETQIAPMPGIDSLVLQEADIVVRDVLAVTSE